MKRAVVEERFEYKGYPCVVIMQASCFRTGYVGIPENNSLYGKDYNDFAINCHGGLTYSGECLFDQEDTDRWWIGFDTGHCFDGKDFETGKKLFSDDASTMRMILISERIEEEFLDASPFRDLEYCKNECRKIVDQLEEITLLEKENN